MTKKKNKAEAAEKKLKDSLKRLKTELATAEKSAKKWKQQAKDEKAKRSSVKTELARVRRALAAAEASAAKWKERAKTAPTTEAEPTRALVQGDTSTSTPEIETAVDGSTGPDESWNVTRLRAEARSRGLAGYSRKSKEQLLAELRG